MRFNYGCPFCMKATDWLNLGYKARCVACKAEGTNRMQICHSCEQVNFVYTNRGELCADCISVSQRKDHCFEEEEYKTCPFFCGTVQVFMPFKEEGIKIGDRCSKCTVLTIEKSEQCCVCKRNFEPIYWYKGKNTCLACFNHHKRWFENTAAKAGGHFASSKDENLDDEYEPSPNTATQENFCGMCLERKMHYNHGLYSVCSGCHSKRTNEKQVCLKCDKDAFVYLNRGNMCLNCNLQKHPQP